MACAALQEPLVLRHHGIRLTQEAAFVGCVAMLLQHLWAKERATLGRLPTQLRLLANLQLLLGFGGCLAVTNWAVDAVRGLARGDSFGILQPTLVFVLAWLPTAVAFSGRGQTRLHGAWVAIFCSWSIAMSAQLGRSPVGLTELFVIALVAISAVLLVRPSRPES